MVDVWIKCLELVSERVSSQNFKMWFKPIKFLKMEEGSIQIEVPNRFFQNWLRDNYLSLITECFNTVTHKDCSVTFRLSNQPKKVKIKQSSLSPLEKRFRENNLNPKYTFENFVVGKSNEFAQAACYAVANNPSSKYNPLFIYGGVGLGKTHLLQAIGHRAVENKSDIRVCYYSSERFMNELINSIRYEKTEEFRRKFRGMEILLIDDIQFFAGKNKTQEEFFHTFNTLHETHRQIVVTSDQFPKDIPRLEERLRTRFEWGLIADIQPPEMETKVAILKKKADIEGIPLPDDVGLYLASIVRSNVRELEGYLIRIGAYSSLTECEITVDMAKEVLKGLIKEEDKTITVEDIQKGVVKYFNIKLSDLKSKKKLKNIAYPRQIAMYLSRRLTDASFYEIGQKFGKKDHSTVIHACKKIETILNKDKGFNKTINIIKKSLNIKK